MRWTAPLMIVACNALTVRNDAALRLTRARTPSRTPTIQCSKKSRRKKKAAAKETASADNGEVQADGMVCDENGCRYDAQPQDFAASAVLESLAQSADSGNVLLPTPAAYDEIVDSMPDDEVIIVRYGAPWCRSCRRIGPDLQALAAEKWPTATFYELSLVRNGKAAGERMHKHFKARVATTIPYFEVYQGRKLVEALDAKALDLRSGDPV